MMIQPGRPSDGSKGAKTPRPSKGQDTGLFSWFTSICKAGLLIGALVAFFYTYISLKQQIDITDRAINKTKAAIKQTEREYDAQRNLYASRCSITYIRRQIIRFRLPLYTAEERQQHKLVLATAQEVARRPLLLQNRTVAFSNAGRTRR